MMRACYPTLLIHGRPRSLRRCGVALARAIGKLTCLLVLFQIACPTIEFKSEEVETAEIELLAHPVQRSGGISLGRLLARFQEKAPSSGSARGPLSAHDGPRLSRVAVGHRLANGLLAPLRC